jgi:hypothetical protein
LRPGGEKEKKKEKKKKKKKGKNNKKQALGTTYPSLLLVCRCTKTKDSLYHGAVGLFQIGTKVCDHF